MVLGFSVEKMVRVMRESTTSGHTRNLTLDTMSSRYSFAVNSHRRYGRCTYMYVGCDARTYMYMYMYRYTCSLVPMPTALALKLFRSLGKQSSVFSKAAKRLECNRHG